uniref:GIY-YIG nuclease n=1 Tax=Mimivirus LCMiAC01 TaxID=2506608 RepID=A0A481Z0R1_9VIRU|nr:MAG: GIY-YIG nuclease [Mimivirus LCMiAC01]
MWYCYILTNTYESHKHRTYVGASNNPKRRIRQHNNIIKGGAKYTSAFGNHTWKYMVLLAGLPTKINALQCEWKLKHPENKKRTRKIYCRPKGRIKGLSLVLKSKKWTNNSIINNSDMELKMWILNKYVDFLDLDNLPKNIKVIPVDKIDPGVLVNV